MSDAENIASEREHDLASLTRVFARIGVLSFGGPAAQIALMHRELVDERPWLTEKEYLSALSFCMLLPGPEAMQLATYAGWKLKGVVGGLIAGTLFVLPGALVIAALAAVYAALGQVPLVQALFLGVKATVIVVVLQALFRVAGKALQGPAHWVLAALAFLGLFAFGLPFPLIIATAAAYGFVTTRGVVAADRSALPPRQGTLGTIALWLTLWWAPVLMLWAAGANFLTQLALFFSNLAVVTFGGAYAVLAYMTQQVVQEHGWLTTAQMMDGLGLAETTPGPLILVTQFVGHTAGFAEGGAGLAAAAGLVTLWVTFVPCFLWIFAAAPYLDWIASRPRLTGALNAITAAVVGVILNLSLWFALNVLFGEVRTLTAGPVTLPLPAWATLDPAALALAALAALCLLRFRLALPLTLLLTALAGAGLSFVA